MKHLKQINEIVAKYNDKEDRFLFNPLESDSTIIFYLHKDDKGFAMNIASEDKDSLETILKNNNIDYTISNDSGHIPF